ncbi:hypothetical protein BFP70_12635 [Thioclava sp. SK-1]|uniref:Hint domain-containing protein n=1 Tax=Thioclava sp. SK-1 TaxID=1889770 RepID=UPI000824C3EB|nr:Hint domain-containing protein [Thioclava sp. SK-1]OCX63058.1 hypothetical protein BFP70_12635 [Thioclava sp. SK-1]
MTVETANSGFHSDPFPGIRYVTQDFREFGDAAPSELRLQFDDYAEKTGTVLCRTAQEEPVFIGELQHFTGTVPCFTPESKIATATGDVAIADLIPGMRVITRDNGLQQVRWVGRRHFGWRALGLNPFLRPVLIKAGSLGPEFPQRDMLVSPNHRFLASASELPGERLGMAQDFLDRDGVERVAARRVEYMQVLLDRHELLLVDGCWSESYQPQRSSIALLDAAQREELCRIVPALAHSPAPAFEAVRPQVLDTHCEPAQ